MWPLSRVLCVAVIIGLLAGGLAGCTAPREGQLAVYLQGGPLDGFLSLFLNVTKIEVHRQAVTQNVPAEGWIVVMEARKRIDLTAYADNSSRAFLAVASLTAHTYREMRFTFTGADAVLEGGNSSVTVALASETTRVSRPFAIADRETTRVILDIDLPRALTRDDAGFWTLSPAFAEIHVQEDAAGEEGDVRDA